MGGYGSTRWNATATRLTTADALRLDLGKLIRDRCIIPGEWVKGTLRWTSTRTGQTTASLGYEANMADPAAAWLRLTYSHGDTSRDYRIELETTRPTYGGLRWWFTCPRTGRRASVLYLPPGAAMFASRAAYRLAYPSQREQDFDRLAEKSHRLRERLGGEPGFGNYIPRPKGMHRRTYERICREIWAAERACLAGFAARYPLGPDERALLDVPEE